MIEVYLIVCCDFILFSHTFALNLFNSFIWGTRKLLLYLRLSICWSNSAICYSDFHTIICFTQNNLRKKFCWIWTLKQQKHKLPERKIFPRLLFSNENDVMMAFCLLYLYSDLQSILQEIKNCISICFILPYPVSTSQESLFETKKICMTKI
jgi:hypothetical protein